MAPGALVLVCVGQHPCFRENADPGSVPPALSVPSRVSDLISCTCSLARCVPATPDSHSSFLTLRFAFAFPLPECPFPTCLGGHPLPPAHLPCCLGGLTSGPRPRITPLDPFHPAFFSLWPFSSLRSICSYLWLFFPQPQGSASSLRTGTWVFPTALSLRPQMYSTNTCCW